MTTPLAFLVDGTNYVTTYWHGTHGEGQPASEALVAMVDGFSRAHNPELVTVAFDSGGRTHRHEAFEGYKAGRSEKDPRLLEELDRAAQLSLDAVGVMRLHGVEADDLLASMTRAMVETGYRVVIQSRDKDLRQLLCKGSVTLMTKANRDRGEWSYQYFSADDLLPLLPEQWADYQALCGESDGWPGADGIGPKTAQSLLVAFGNLEGILEAITDWPHSLDLTRAKVRLNRTQVNGLKKLDVELARKITRLRTDVLFVEVQA